MAGKPKKREALSPLPACPQIKSGERAFNACIIDCVETTDPKDPKKFKTFATNKTQIANLCPAGIVPKADIEACHLIQVPGKFQSKVTFYSCFKTYAY